MARLRECAIGLVPCAGVSASVATAFQCVTALPRDFPAEWVASASRARAGMASASVTLVSAAMRESRGTILRSGKKRSRFSALVVCSIQTGGTIHVSLAWRGVSRARDSEMKPGMPVCRLLHSMLSGETTL